MSSRYQSILTQKTDEGKTIFSQTYYPEIEPREDDIYIITSNTDRFDLIALDFWGDESYWWVIPSINGLECDSFYPPIGIQLRVPKDITSIINEFNKENEL